MPALNRQQFWRANPNQMALPALEEQSHPGAKLLSQGFHFEHGAMPVSKGVHIRTLSAVHGNEPVASLEWMDQPDKESGAKQGEIQMVDTSPGHLRKGIATTLYGMGRTLAKVKPQHSVYRTADGDDWAPKASAKYGGRVPKGRDMNK